MKTRARERRFSVRVRRPGAAGATERHRRGRSRPSRGTRARLNEVNSAAEVRVRQASREGREVVNYGFYRGVFFAVFCAGLLFATALLYRLTVRRLFTPTHRRRLRSIFNAS